MASEYAFPLQIANYFASSVHLKEMLESVIEDTVELCEKNKNDINFIPPIVYSRQGSAYNIDYNYLVHCIAWKVGDQTIETDFLIHKGDEAEKYKRAEFLVCGILEGFFDLVQVNNNKVDLSRYKNARVIELKKRFFNVVCIQNGTNVRRFSAVPINGLKLRKLISLESLDALNMISDDENFQQVAFGENQYSTYLSANKLNEVEYVYWG